MLQVRPVHAGERRRHARTRSRAAAGHLSDRRTGTNQEKARRRMEKCRQYLPNGGEATEARPRSRPSRCASWPQCMRENGVPNFPDPEPTAASRLDNGQVDGWTRRPDVQGREEKCQQLRPNPDDAESGPASRQSPRIAAPDRRHRRRIAARVRGRLRGGGGGRRRRGAAAAADWSAGSAARPARRRRPAAGDRAGDPADAGRHARPRTASSGTATPRTARRPARAAPSPRCPRPVRRSSGAGRSTGSTTQPVVLLYGALPAYRTLAAGHRGRRRQAVRAEPAGARLHRVHRRRRVLRGDRDGGPGVAGGPRPDETGRVEPGRIVVRRRAGPGRRATRPSVGDAASRGAGGAARTPARPGWSPSTWTSTTSGWPARAPRSASAAGRQGRSPARSPRSRR